MARSKEEQIRDLLKELALGKGKTFIAIVENNYPDKDMVDVRAMDGTLYTDVRKRASVDSPDKGILITPASKSSVIVSRIGESDELFIEMFSEVENIVFYGGRNEGTVKVKELTEQLNALEKDLNNLKTAFSSWVTVPNDGGAALKTITTTWAGSNLQLTDKKSLQNDKIKH